MSVARQHVNKARIPKENAGFVHMLENSCLDWFGQEATCGFACVVCCVRVRINEPVQGVPSTGNR